MQSNKVNVVRKEQNVKGVESVDRALTILDAMARKRAAMTLHELSLATNFYKSTILRLITSLEKFGYIRKREDGRYVLGPACATLAGAQSAAFDLAGLMRATIERLAEATGETVSFYIRDGNERVCAQRRNSTHAIRHHVEEGQRMSLEKRGSASQILLAFSGDEGPGLERVRNEGYAVSLGERDPDAAGIAVPIFDAKDHLLGALTVSGLRSRFTFEVVDRVRDELLAARAELEHNLGRSVE